MFSGIPSYIIFLKHKIKNLASRVSKLCVGGHSLTILGSCINISTKNVKKGVKKALFYNFGPYHGKKFQDFYFSNFFLNYTLVAKMCLKMI